MKFNQRIGFCIGAGILLAIFIALGLIPHNGKTSGAQTNDLDNSYRKSVDNAAIHNKFKSKRVQNAPRAKDPRVANALKTIYYTDDVLARKQLDKYLDLVGRNADTVALAYWLTSDLSYIHDLRDYVNSPVALQLVSQFDPDLDVAAKAAQRLMEIDPKNPMGYYLAARSNAIAGNVEAALALLRQTSEIKGPLTNATPEKYQSVLSALKNMGMDSTEAHLYLWNHSDILTTSHFALRQMTAALLQAGQYPSGDSLALRASSLLQICLRTAGETDYSVDGARQSLENEALILKSLPDDYEYGVGQTVAERKIEIKKVYKSEFQKNVDLSTAMRVASEETMNQYVRMVEDLGWHAARDWMIAGKSE